MSAYNPPNEDWTIYNAANYQFASDSITIQQADDRYLKQVGGIASGLITFGAGLSTPEIYNSGTLTLPTATTTLIGNNTTSTLEIIGAGTSTITSNFKLNCWDTVNDYIAFNLQNLSSGSGASTDIICTNDKGNANYGFIDMGVNSSASSYVGGVSDGYLYTQQDTDSNGGNLWLGAHTLNKKLYLFASGVATIPTAISWDATTLQMPAGSIINAIAQKIGATGTVLNMVEQANSTITNSSLAALSTLTKAITFTSNFASAPNIQVSVNSSTGTNQQFLTIMASAITTVGMTVSVYNTNATTAITGDITIAYIAIA